MDTSHNIGLASGTECDATLSRNVFGKGECRTAEECEAKDDANPDPDTEFKMFPPKEHGCTKIVKKKHNGGVVHTHKIDKSQIEWGCCAEVQD